MSYEWREEDGLRYLTVDYRGGLSKEQMLALLEHQVTQVEAAGHGAKVLILIDPEERPHSDFIAAVKRAYRERMDPAGAKVAFVGAAGVGRPVVRGLQLIAGGLGAIMFPDRDKALEFLARS